MHGRRPLPKFGCEGHHHHEARTEVHWLDRRCWRVSARHRRLWHGPARGCRPSRRPGGRSMIAWLLDAVWNAALILTVWPLGLHACAMLLKAAGLPEGGF